MTLIKLSALQLPITKENSKVYPTSSSVTENRIVMWRRNIDGTFNKQVWKVLCALNSVIIAVRVRYSTILVTLSPSDIMKGFVFF